MKIPLKHFFATPLRIEFEVIQTTGESRAIFTVQTENSVISGENMATTMQATSLATVSVTWKTASGQPAKVDGATTWTSSDPTIVKATVASGNSAICNLESYEKTGDVSIQATADADLGEGMKNVTAVLAITVVPGEAVGGDITFTQGASGPSSPGGGTPPPTTTATKK